MSIKTIYPHYGYTCVNSVLTLLGSASGRSGKEE